MALFKAAQVVAKQPIPTADCATDLVPVFGDFTIPANIATGDVVEMVPQHAGYTLVDLIVDADALGATFTVDIGWLSGNFDSTGARTCSAEIAAAKAMGTAKVVRPDVAGFSRKAPVLDAGSGVPAHRGIGFVATNVVTPTAGAKIRFTALVRPMIEGQ